MLIRYRFNNYCSFWGENEFSMEAPSGKVKRRFPDNYVEDESGCCCLKTAVIVGENAGGKSNFINSLKYLKSLFLDNGTVRSFPAYLNSACIAAGADESQIFELEILPEAKHIYRYRLEIDKKGICSESLFVRSAMRARETACFSVHREKGKGYVVDAAAAELSASAMTENGIGLFVTKLAILGNEDALQVTNWMNNTLYAEILIGESEANIRQVQSDLEILKDKRYLDIFRMVDYSICDIEVDEEKPYSKTAIIRKNQDGKLQKRELLMDSAGVREFFAWAVQIFRVVYENKVIFADEMDRVLNPILSDRVVAYINGKQHIGQFVFSTHNVLHLNLTTYMKEQIYFVTKDRNTLISEIYSLSDFPEVRYETTKIYEFYMKGILGGTADE